MAETEVVDIGTMITSSPEIRGGRPRVAGTGVTVMRIVGWYKLGFTPEEIARKIDLSLAQIYAALAYYHANRDAIDNDLIHALRLHNVDVVKAWDVGMREGVDEEHLLFAKAQRRVLFGFNAGDYQRLHTEFLTQGRSHAGIVLAK